MIWIYALASLCFFAVPGRLVLAALPGGSPGGHALRELPVTVAASLILGGLLWCATLSMTAGTGHFALLLLPATSGALVVARALCGPFALVPRHEPALPRESWTAELALLMAGIALVGWVAWLIGTDPAGRPALAGVVLVQAPMLLWALETARASAWARAGALLALAPVAWISTGLGSFPASAAATAFGAGTCASVAWVRRADRRALVLAIVFTTGSALFDRDAWPAALAGAAVIVIATPRPSRGRALAIALASAAVCGLLALAQHGAWSETDPVRLAATDPARLDTSYRWLLAPLFVPIVLAWWFDARGIARPAWNSSGAPVGRERVVVLGTVLLSLGIALVARLAGLELRIEATLLPALFALVLVLGLALQRVTARG